MPTLIAYQNGNWTGATTWKTAAGGTGAEQLTLTSGTNTTTSDVASSNFTLTNTHICEGLLLHCNRLNTTGTVTVGLYRSTTLQREVTVNASDLPSTASWVFFKFATTVTADGSTTYNVRVRGSSAGNAIFWHNATTANWSRAVRRDNAIAPVAADPTFICDELTGQATKVDIEVTMDSTATTAYGECNIGAGGVLSYGTSASTNYHLQLAGNLNIWGDGTLNIGTSGTRIPSTSTATLQFTNATNVDRGVEVRSGGVFNLFGATKTGTQALLTADAASGQAIITVNSTTGWTANDVIALASTTRTSSQSEKATVSTVDSGTQATLTGNLVNTHHGVAPYVGEVVNLTRNVKVRGTSQTLCAYVHCAINGTFTAEYGEFFFLGSATSNKQGISTASSATAVSVKFCSFYDFFNNASAGFSFGGGILILTIEDCVIFWGSACTFSVAANSSSTSPSIQRNYIIGGSNNNANIQDVGGTIRDNRFGGSRLTLTEQNATIGTIKDNIQHSADNGITFGTSSPMFGTVDGLTVWRNSTTGLLIAGSGYTITNASVYHNATTNVSINTTGSASAVTILNSTFNGGSGASLAATTDHFRNTTTVVTNIIFDNCTFGATTTATNAINISTANFTNVLLRRCTVTESNIVTNQSNLVSGSFGESTVAFDKFANTSGSHRTYKRYGRSQSDQTIFRTAAPSEALLPNNASNKLSSGLKKLAVASGESATVSTYVQKSLTYNGNQPRLLVKQNSIAGIASNTVLDTAVNPTVTPTLDAYAGAIAAYSLRKINSSYTGSCIRVWRSTDSATLDVGFDVNGELDIAAINAFSTRALIDRWYDQSGNNRTAFIENLRPEISSGGVVHTVNGKPAIYFLDNSGLYSFLAINSVASAIGTNPFVAHSVIYPESTSLEMTVFGLGTTSNLHRHSLEMPSTDVFQITRRNASTDLTLSSTATYSANTRYLLFHSFSGTDGILDVNNAEVINGNLNVTPNAFNRGRIGGRVFGSTTDRYFLGYMQELVFWSSDRAADRTALQSNVNAYYNLFPEWQELTGTTATVSDDCVLEVYVDCDGTAGTVNVDDWSVS